MGVQAEGWRDHPTRGWKESLRLNAQKEIADRGGSSPAEAEKHTSKEDVAAGAGAGAAAVGAGGAAAVAAVDDDEDDDAFHEAPVASKAAAQKAVNADTEKVKSHDEEAAKAAPAATAASRNSQADSTDSTAVSGNGSANGDAPQYRQAASGPHRREGRRHRLQDGRCFRSQEPQEGRQHQRV